MKKDASKKEAVEAIGDREFDYIFDIKTYKTAKVTQPDLDTLVAENVCNSSVRVTFKRAIRTWKVEVRVLVGAKDQRDVIFLSGKEPTEKMMDFWTELSLLATEHASDTNDGLRSLAVNVLSRKTPL